MDETIRIERPDLVQPKKFAPRPTYEHRAIFDRVDDDLDDLEYRIGALPVDRLFDLREAFEGFVDQGSYTGVKVRPDTIDRSSSAFRAPPLSSADAKIASRETHFKLPPLPYL